MSSLKTGAAYSEALIGKRGGRTRRSLWIIVEPLIAVLVGAKVGHDLKKGGVVVGDIQRSFSAER